MFIFILQSLFLTINHMDRELVEVRVFDNKRLCRMPNLTIWIVNLFGCFTCQFQVCL
jgi:hypothetical protein